MSGDQQAEVMWVHDAMLSPAVLREGVPAVFVFDEAWIVFMAECLEEMPGVQVRRGDVVQEVGDFAAAHGAGVLLTHRAADPRLVRQVEALAGTLEVQPVGPEPFVELPAQPDLKRFSRYWRKAERALKRP